MGSKLKDFKKRVKFLVRPIREYISNSRVRENAYYYHQLKKNSIKKNSVLLESYHAVSMTGNVYAIFTELVKSKPDYDFYWVYAVDKDPMMDCLKKEFPDSKLHFVKHESKEYYRLLASCEILINDTSFMPYFIKQKGQTYVNTWHGTPLKTLGLDIKGSGWADHKNIQRNLLQADKLLMPNKFTADRLITSHDLNGILPAQVYVTGNARVDLSFDDAKKIRQKYQLGEKKIVLFAPTWKKDIEDTTVEDLQQLINQMQSLQQKVGEDYKVLLKTHYFVYDFFVKEGFGDQVLPNWIDTNELLSAVDILITDYSSIFFDFLPLKRPVYFYIPDKEAYAKARGFYMDLDTLPGLVSENLDEIGVALAGNQSVYLQEYATKYEKFWQKYLYLDDGKARKRAVKAIFDQEGKDAISYESGKKKIMMYAGGFYNNGITISAINLSNYIDYDKYELIFWDFSKINAEKAGNIMRVNPKAHFIYKFSNTIRDLSDTYNQNWIYRQGANTKFGSMKKYQKQIAYEVRRILGNFEPDVVIDFGGYNKMFTAITAAAPFKRKVVYLHNDMLGEYNKVINGKYKHRWNLKVTFSMYNYFDEIVSVSESVNDQNKQNLKPWIRDLSKMVYVNNVVDAKGVLEQKQLVHEQLEGLQKSRYDQQYRIVFDESVNWGGILTEKSFIKPAEDKINFINVARLSPEKNQINLIKAFEKIVAKNKQVHLYIVGNGPLRRQLEDLIYDLGLSEYISLTGYVSKPAMLTELTDCFILPSNYEGQGLSIIEAMLLEKPIIGTDVPGIHSVISGTAGLLVENTIDGIAKGMDKFINGEIKASNVNHKKYNDEALQQFYSIVIGNQ